MTQFYVGTEEKTIILLYVVADPERPTLEEHRRFEALQRLWREYREQKPMRLLPYGRQQSGHPCATIDEARAEVKRLLGMK